METVKRLFFIALSAFLAGGLLGGCASTSPAPVEEARLSAEPTPAAIAARAEPRGASAPSAPAVATPKRAGAESTAGSAAPGRAARSGQARANTGASPLAASKAPGSASNAPPAERSPEMLFTALAAAGFDYQRGGKSMSTGFDCSGLVAHVFREAYGVLLPHNAAAQSEHGREVSRDELEPGDLVFFNTERRRFSHVGIYLGDNRFIHAPKPGAVVRTENMQVSYWRTRFDGARRIIE